MACCRCNRSGICRNCSCAREGKACISCLPKRLGQCKNIQPDTNAGRGQSSTNQTTRRISQDLQTVDSTSAEEGEMVGQDDFVSNALPSFPLANPPNFTWGEKDGVKVKDDIDRIYSEVVLWRHNLFKIPSGKHGKDFVHEMA